MIRVWLYGCTPMYYTYYWLHCLFSASTQFKTDLHEVLDNRDVDGLLEMMDETRDVYTRGFLLSTPKEDIQTFFEGGCFLNWLYY